MKSIKDEQTYEEFKYKYRLELSDEYSSRLIEGFFLGCCFSLLLSLFLLFTLPKNFILFLIDYELPKTTQTTKEV